MIIRRDVLLPALLSAVNQYANYAGTFGFVPILAKQLGASNVVQSLLVAMSIGVVTLGNLMATTIVRKAGAKHLVYLSFLCVSAGMGTAALAHSLFVVFLAQLLIGLSQGICYPVLMGMSIEHVADAKRTTAMGLHQAVYAIGMFAGPWLSGLLADIVGIRLMFALTALACLILGLAGTRELTH